MPAKSKAQFKKVQVLYRQGKITKAELDRFTQDVNYKSLPKKKKPRPTNRQGKKRGGR